MEVTWRIRKAMPKDADALAGCMESAYAAYQDRMGGVRLPPMDVDYLSEITSYPSWVIESEGRVLGGMIMTFGNDHASIANIAVDPRSQGQGLGGALMKFAESTAREKNCSELHLTTHVLLHENLSLYRHFGWEEIGRNEVRIFMKKTA